jgi:RecA-family ATPase
MSFDSTDEQDQQDRQANVDRFRFAEWRALLATMPDAASKLETFQEAADDIAGQFAAGRFAKPTGVDQLDDMARTYGLTEAIGQPEVERIIGAAFTKAEQDKAKKKPPFTYVDITRELVPREWAVPDRIPATNLTLLSGEGAVGKSILLLQLSAAIVLGRDWIGTLPKQGVVLYLSCEEDDDEINRRLEDIAKHYGVTRADLKPSLHVISLAGKDAILGTADRTSQIRPTALFTQLRAEALRLRPMLIVVDTVADVFGGDEINRAQTRHFLTMLRGLITEIDSAMVLASHPSLEGIKSGSGISGSTAWHNSVRSRMYFRNAAEVDDPELRVLEVKKANYAKTSEQILLRWKNGVYVPEPRAGSLDQMAADKKIDDLFLDLLRRFTKEGRKVSDKPSSTYAPTVFADEAEAKTAKASRKALAEAMKRLFVGKKIRVQTDGPVSRQRNRIAEVGLEESAVILRFPGSSNDPSNPPSNTLPTPSNDPSNTPPLYPPIALEGGGGVGSPPPSNASEGKEKERFRVVGKAPDGTVCVECHQAGGTFKIKDTSVSDSKPAVLHPGCAPIWFGAVQS